MLAFIMGILGFALCFAYDINSITMKCRVLSSGFAAGSLLIGAATVLPCIEAWREGCFAGLADIGLLAVGALAAAALAYCLFFALPFEKTYTAPVQGRRTYTFGAYALCRHPGIICFFIMQLCLGLAARPAGVLISGMVLSALNLAYALFQDVVTFPKTFCDYEDYRKRVPFLIPTAGSMARAKKTWGYPYEKEEKL